MSELFMECVEEELEPWQKQAPQIHLIEDDDDEPIFVGVLSTNQKDTKPNPVAPPKKTAEKEPKRPAAQPTFAPSHIMLPINIGANPANAAPQTLTTLTPRPVIVNNQGFIVTSPHLSSSAGLIAPLGSQYPPGTKFAIVPAGQQQLLQPVAPSTMNAVIPGVVHRPQVQQITKNIVTLSNVRAPVVFSTHSNLTQPNSSNSQSFHPLSVPAVSNSKTKDQIVVKRVLPPPEQNNNAKKIMLDLGSTVVKVPVENGNLKKKCPKCQEVITEEQLKCHVTMCGSKPASPNVDNGPNKRIMLVSEFYYGQFEGDAHKLMRKTNTTFKCRSCLKVLKNNIRFMNHMKHHLELEKQNSESWESHTTCQHCYRQYMTPFQLQCHIESAHSRIESSTNCKICELAFGSEQGLLEHMKEDHKPGEMPYVCQVCNYRSSFFSDVETHFRTVHENTKELLCPFCLKILRSGHMYMQHYMKHQRKGIHRCGKCRLNFLTYKEKVEHRTHVHKTFRKPKALEGLPAGTKVTIRASLTGKAPTQHSSSDRPSTVTISPDGVGERASQAVVKSRAKSTGTGAVKASMGPPSKKQCGDPSRNNLALRNLSADGGRYTCIECCSVVDHFFSHFPMVLACGACKYRTSCKVSIGNHMIKFHSTRKTPQKMDYSKNPSSLKLTLVCLNCDLLVDVSSGDLMTKHLTDQPNHICKVIQDRDIRAKDQLNVVHRQPENVAPLLMSANVQGSAEAVVKPVGIVALPPSNLPDSMRTAADEEQDSADGDVTAGPTDA
ncbi:zinc finger protein 280D isoform X2 [Takifugu rubripes]|nr:zinc finger protein 280D isoform X2 [Takifugu rubripes]